jgi:poly-gamma-glutamate capsule biosynthesis protein CapA/YwtB (metallophosphatase superfamily)
MRIKGLNRSYRWVVALVVLIFWGYAIQCAAAPVKNLSIVFAGDIMLASSVGDKLDQAGGDYVLKLVKEELSSADLAIGNLECAVGVTGKPVKDKKYTFRARPEYLEAIKKAGFDVLSLANNHVLDYGESAFLETLANLKKYGLDYVGGGKNEQQANAPLYINIKGIRIAILASSHVLPSVAWKATGKNPGLASLYAPERFLAELKRARLNSDLLITYLHWGKEGAVKPESYQKNLAHSFIDKGADVVVGAHPHVLQGFEWYKGKLIAYSLGNFVFNSKINESALLQVNFSGRKLKCARLIPCEIKNYRPLIITNKNKIKAFYNNLACRSFKIKFDKDGNILNNRN